MTVRTVVSTQESYDNSGKSLHQDLKTHQQPCMIKKANLTENNDIVKEAEKHYSEVFREKPINNEHIKYKMEVEALCLSRLKECSKIKIPEWAIAYVTNVLNQLKQGKSKYAYDLPNEIFKPGIEGDDLIHAVTKLINQFKN